MPRTSKYDTTSPVALVAGTSGIKDDNAAANDVSSMAPVAGLRCDTYDPDTAHGGKRPHGRRTVSDARKTRAPPDRVILEPERALITGYSRGWWWKLEQEGMVPKRIKLGPKRVGWLLSELEQWLRERAAARDGGDADAPTA